MPCVGFKCPIERIEADFDHFDTCTAGPGGRPAASPWMTRFAYEKENADLRHQGFNLTTTRTMGCPREQFIKVFLPYYTNPAAKAAADRGSALHVMAAKYAPPGWITEIRDPVRMAVEGKLFKEDFPDDDGDGVTLSGLIDAVNPGVQGLPWELVDWKFPKDWSIGFRGKNPLTNEIQMNINRLLLAQQPWAIEEGYDPDTALLTIWDHAIGKAEGPAPLVIKHVTEFEILEARPFGGQYTVREIIETHLAIKDLIDEEGGEEALLAIKDTQRLMAMTAQIPMVGETQMNASKCSSYCDVEYLCSKALRAHGRPVSQGETNA